MAATHHATGQELSEPHKRKREHDDNGSQSGRSDRIPQPPPPLSGNGAPINYLSKANPSRLRLIHGDTETFSDVLSLLSDYEGVLSRHESLASNLGAKLTAPRLLRAMEGLFEGGINASPQSPFKDSRGSSWYTPSWLEILSFAKSNPNEFALTTTQDGRRVCQFVFKNVQVEIMEDDWRLIMSGALDRFRLVPPHPLEEDETAELATLEILEQRLETLIKKADEVARKARQLNYHLSGRKASINTRRSSPQPQSSGFQPVNPPRASSSGYDLHADLLQQFLSPLQPTVLSRPPSTTSNPNPPLTPSELPRPRHTPTTSQTHILLPSARPSPAQQLQLAVESPSAPPPGEDPSTVHRVLIQASIEKLNRGEAILPPCDRCRRLKTSCIKHLTACQGCTRKHAKCSWKVVTDAEVAILRAAQQPGAQSQGQSSSSYPGVGPTAVADDGEDGDDIVLPDIRERVESEGAARVLRDIGTARHFSSADGQRYNFGLGLRGTPDAAAQSDSERWEREARDEGPLDMDLDTRKTDKGKEIAPAPLRPDTPSMRDHSMLSHMASVASAAADAREAREANSRMD